MVRYNYYREILKKWNLISKGVRLNLPIPPAYRHVLCPVFPLTTRHATLQISSFFRLLQLVTKMTIHGTLTLFDPDEEDWVEYTNKLSYYFTANGITNIAKCAILISCCAPATFRLMKSFVSRTVS